MFAFCNQSEENCLWESDISDSILDIHQLQRNTFKEEWILEMFSRRAKAVEESIESWEIKVSGRRKYLRVTIT